MKTTTSTPRSTRIGFTWSRFYTPENELAGWYLTSTEHHYDADGNYFEPVYGYVLIDGTKGYRAERVQPSGERQVLGYWTGMDQAADQVASQATETNYYHYDSHRPIYKTETAVANEKTLNFINGFRGCAAKEIRPDVVAVHYCRSVEPAILVMQLISCVVVRRKGAIHQAQQIAAFLDYTLLEAYDSHETR